MITIMDAASCQGEFVLPDDILRQVLLQLPRRQRILTARFVCRHWRHVASLLVDVVRIKLPPDVHTCPWTAFPAAVSKLVVVVLSGSGIADVGDALVSFLDRNAIHAAQVVDLKVVCAPDQVQHLPLAVLRRVGTLCCSLRSLSLLHLAPKLDHNPSASSFSPIPAHMQLPQQLTGLRVHSHHWQPFPWAAIADLKHLRSLQMVAHGPLAPTSPALLGLGQLPALEHLHLELRPAFVAASATGVFTGVQHLMCTRMQTLRLHNAQQVCERVVTATSVR